MPFTAYAHESMFSSDPHVAPKPFDSIYARRSDGSFAYHYTAMAPNGSPTELMMKSFSDLRLRKQAILEPFTRSAVVFQMNEREVRNQQRLQNGCHAIPAADLKRDSVPGPTMLGFEVVRIIRKTESETTESWVAPELNCYPLQENITFSGGAHNEAKVMKIDAGEPPQVFFEVPDEFVKRSPLQLDAEYKIKFGHGFWGERAMGNTQKRYYRGPAQ